MKNCEFIPTPDEWVNILNRIFPDNWGASDDKDYPIIAHRLHQDYFIRCMDGTNVMHVYVMGYCPIALLISKEFEREGIYCGTDDFGRRNEFTLRLYRK